MDAEKTEYKRPHPDAWTRWKKRSSKLELATIVVVFAALFTGDYSSDWGWMVLVAGLGICWWLANWSDRWYEAERKREKDSLDAWYRSQYGE